MTPSNEEICENCGHTKEEHLWDCNDNGDMCLNQCHIISCGCKKFVPKNQSNNGPKGYITEMPEKVGLCNGSVPNQKPCNIDFNGDVFPNQGKTGNQENCEICKDYPKEYWCGAQKSEDICDNNQKIRLICGKCGTEQFMKVKRYGKKPEDYTLYCPNCKDNICPSACKFKQKEGKK